MKAAVIRQGPIPEGPWAPGAYVALVGTPGDALEARRSGWSLRDTLLILHPGGKTTRVFLFRRSLQGTVAKNVLQHGAGALNIDGCRVGTSDNLNGGAYSRNGRAAPLPGDDRVEASLGMFEPGAKPEHGYKQPVGRWPTNLILVHALTCQLLGTQRVKGSHSVGVSPGSYVKKEHVYGKYGKGWTPTSHVGEDGKEAAPLWECAPDCPARILNEQSGQSTSRKGAPRVGKSGAGWGMTATGAEYDDAGGAARFFPQVCDFDGAMLWVERLLGLSV